jgi:hypothetical protein
MRRRSQAAADLIDTAARVLTVPSDEDDSAASRAPAKNCVSFRLADALRT